MYRVAMNLYNIKYEDYVAIGGVRGLSQYWLDHCDHECQCWDYLDFPTKELASEYFDSCVPSSERKGRGQNSVIKFSVYILYDDLVEMKYKTQGDDYGQNSDL